MLGKIIHAHPVHTGTALVLLHAPIRREHVGALDRPFHKVPVAASRALPCIGRRPGFAASLAMGSFTPCLQRELQLLAGLLAHGPSVTHGRSALPSFGPSRLPATMASADFSLRG